MKALVTGARGFVGRHLVERLERDGWEVMATDIGPGQFLDVKDKLQVWPKLQGVDVVFHLGAIVGVEAVLKAGAERVVETNLIGTLNVLQAARRHGARVVFASTSEAAGCGENLPYGEDDYRVYGPTSTARWVYAETKALGEHLCLDFAAKGTPATAVRLFNAYGPGLEGRVFTRWARQILSGGPVSLIGTGCQTRCFTWIDDVVEGLIRCASLDAAIGEVINLGSDAEVQMRMALAELVTALEAPNLPIEYVSGTAVYGEGFQEIGRRVPDVRKAKLFLDWEATTSLREGLEKMAPWLKETCS